MTGIGAYMYIVWGIWLRHCLNHRQDEYELYWPNLWTLPEVRKLDSQPNIKASTANGNTKKTR